MAVDSVLDEDEVIEAQWCERQALRLDKWCSFMLTSTGKFCDTLVTLEALKPSEGKSFMSSSCKFTNEKVLLELTVLFNTDDSIVSLYPIVLT